MLLQTSTDFDLFVYYYFPIFLIAILGIGGIIFAVRRIKKLKRALEVQAIKRSGEVQNSFGGLGYPVLRFNHNSNQVKVYSVPGSKNSPPYTYVVVYLSLPVVQYMRLYKEGFGSKIEKKLGMQDIQIGIESFDENVIIKSSDEFFVRSILTFEVQDLVLKIINNHRADIILDKNELKIIVQKIVYDEATYDELINVATAILDQLEKMKYMS